jgi:hypothetical protein
MISQTPWVERTFNFDFPVGLFPCILERVRGTPARLEELIASFPSSILTIRLNDKWSIQEIVGHLVDLEELHGGRIDDYLARKEMLRAADMMNQKSAAANHNATPITDLLRAFRAERAVLVRRIAALDDEVIARSALHPRLNAQMRLVDMLLFVAEHDDHELAKISRLANALQASEMS